MLDKVDATREAVKEQMANAGEKMRETKDAMIEKKDEWKLKATTASQKSINYMKHLDLETVAKGALGAVASSHGMNDDILVGIGECFMQTEMPATQGVQGDPFHSKWVDGSLVTMAGGAEEREPIRKPSDGEAVCAPCSPAGGVGQEKTSRPDELCFCCPDRNFAEAFWSGRRWRPLLLNFDELPEWRRSRSSRFISSGYRPECSSYKECLRSWLYLHNESFNIHRSAHTMCPDRVLTHSCADPRILPAVTFGAR
jgi:hypothetical protein